MKLQLALTLLVASASADICTENCSDEFVNNCVPFQSQGYAPCREQLDNNVQMLANAGCIPQCTDTAAMAATQDDPNPSPSEDLVDCSSNSMTFSGNSPASPQDLCGVQLCAVWSTIRTSDKCAVLMDVPVTCEGDAGKSCPIAFFYHGAGGTNAAWPQSNRDVIHDGIKTSSASTRMGSTTSGTPEARAETSQTATRSPSPSTSSRRSEPTTTGTLICMHMVTPTARRW